MAKWAAETRAFKVTLRQNIWARIKGHRWTSWSTCLHFTQWVQRARFETARFTTARHSNLAGSEQSGHPQRIQRIIDGVVEELVADKVCGVEENFDANEWSTKYDEQLFELPSLHVAKCEPSLPLFALDIGFGFKVIQKPTHLDWLDLDQAHDWKEVVTGYFQTPSSRIRAYPDEAIESVCSMRIPPTTCQDFAIDTPALSTKIPTSAMEIDLDTAFHWQGMLDLDEEEVSWQAGNESNEVTDKEQGVNDVFSYAKSLLESKRKGLPLSSFIPDESETNGFL
ncbi:MAG: hypothetical protein Q9203_004172 [Teloschistes exilis]